MTAEKKESKSGSTDQHFFVDAFLFVSENVFPIRLAGWFGTYHGGYSYLRSVFYCFQDLRREDIPVEVVLLGMVHSLHLFVRHDCGGESGEYGRTEQVFEISRKLMS